MRNKGTGCPGTPCARSVLGISGGATRPSMIIVSPTIGAVACWAEAKLEKRAHSVFDGSLVQKSWH